MNRASLTPDAATIRELNLLLPHAESLLTGSADSSGGLLKTRGPVGNSLPGIRPVLGCQARARRGAGLRLRRCSSPDTPPSPSDNRIWRWCSRIWGSWRKRAICCARRWPPLRRRSSPDTPPSPSVNRIWRRCSRIWGSWRKRAICCARRWPPLRRRSSPDTPPSPPVNRIWRGAPGSGAVGGSARSAAQGAGLR